MGPTSLLLHQLDLVPNQKIYREEFVSNPKISIIIISFKNWTYTELCLKSIIVNSTYPNYEIIIIDNASDNKTKNNLISFSNNFDNIRIHQNPRNFGFAKANNIGARIARGDYLVFLNNDTIVSEGWLERLLRHLQSIPYAGMVGPVTNAIGNEAKITVDYVQPSIDLINRFAKSRFEKYKGQYFKIENLALFCCIISKQLFEKVDGLDERYKIGMFEDDDLAMKIKQQGLNLYCAEDVFIHHFHGTSFKKLSKIKQTIIFHINKHKFEAKWRTKWKPHKHRLNNYP